MASVIYNVTFTPTVGSLGTQIDYKNNSSSTWITPSSPANPTTLATYPLVLETENSYNVRVSSVGESCIPRYKILNITVPFSGECCPSGYTLSPDETYCFQEDDVSPTIIDSGNCIAVSQLVSQYSVNGAYIYDPGYTIRLVGSRTLLTSQPHWKEIPGQIVGPMNRNGIWLDSDCNGVKDPLTAGQELQFTHPITLSVPKTVYVGIGGDNTFRFQINSTVVVDCDMAFPAGGDPVGANFNFWHLFPVTIPSGTSYLNFAAVGDGLTNNAFAAVIYDNTYAELIAATSDATLTILYRTFDSIGSPIDIATCPAGYFLDASEGPGSYVCRQILTTSTTPC